MSDVELILGEGFSDLPVHEDGVAYIYRLYLGEMCIYVGQSVSLRPRVYQHLADGREFDRVIYDKCPDTESNDFEASAIVLHQPTENRNMPKNNRYVSVAELRKKISTRVETVICMYGVAFEGLSVRKGVRHKYVEKKHADHALENMVNAVEDFFSRLDGDA